MKTNEIRVVRGPTMQDQNIITVVGVITAGVLADKGIIPYYNASTGDGYQRNPAPARVREITKGIKEKRVDLPTAILLNARIKSEKVLRGKDDDLIFDVSRVQNLHIVDGQHRHLALRELLEGGDIPDTYKIPFVSMIGADKDAEMLQFYTVNHTSKSVSTALAFSLLNKLAKAEGGENIRKFLVGQRSEWKIHAQELCEKLNANTPIWRGRVRLPNDKKGKTVLPSASMVSSFESIIKGSAYFVGIGIQRQVQVIDAYWSGIQELIPEAFQNPDKYSVQKGIGVRAMHGIFPDVLERVRARGDSIYVPRSYASILEEPLTRLEGDNGQGKRADGASFWLTGKAGAVANYTSGVGIATLIDKLKTLLPPIEIPDLE